MVCTDCLSIQKGVKPADRICLVHNAPQDYALTRYDNSIMDNFKRRRL